MWSLELKHHKPLHLPCYKKKKTCYCNNCNYCISSGADSCPVVRGFIRNKDIRMQKPSACTEEVCKARGKFGKAGRHNAVCATKYSMMHSRTVHRTNAHTHTNTRTMFCRKSSHIALKPLQKEVKLKVFKIFVLHAKQNKK